ncbi:MAG: diguanylate cyclase [Anaerolineales bacterium]|nr:diguanylate cyclase [Anaerolineales bacterium]
MDTIWIIFAGILFLNTLAALSNAVILIVRRMHKPGSRTIIWMFLALAVWTFSYAMITVSTTPDAKHFWLKMENIGIVATPTLWFLFVAHYTRKDKWLTPPVEFFFFLVPIMTMAFLFSERFFVLHYASTVPYAASGGPLLIERGPWYWVQLTQSYLMLTVGTVLMLWHLFVYRAIYRKRILTVMAAFAIPVLLNIFYQLGSRVLPSLYVPVDLSPISFTVTAGLLSFAIFGQRLFDMTPIARHVVLENIVEMVLVVDGTGRILDINQAALDWLDRTATALIGENIFDVFAAWPALADYCRTASTASETFDLLDDNSQVVEVTISPIYNRFGDLDGRVIVLHDVTERKTMERDLKRANKTLKAKLVEIEKLQLKLREQAIRDPLTGLFNRRYLAEVLDAEIARARRDGQPLSAIIMDVDHFKQFNDSNGHKCGDRVLEQLGQLLLANTRRGDTVCRYGGEEFVILMPKAGLDIALDRAESWRRAFASTEVEYEGKILRAEFSVGVACFPEQVKSGEDLLKAADQALYLSKANGRNQVTAYVVCTQ